MKQQHSRAKGVGNSFRCETFLARVRPVLLALLAYLTYLVFFAERPVVEGDVARMAQIAFQDPATLAMVSIVDLHHNITFWLVNTSVVVAGLFCTELYFFYVREEEHSLLKTRQRLSFTDDHALEFVWTLAPMVATLCISLPSISLLYGMDEDSNRASVDLSVKVIGRQWYWGYEMDELMPSLGALTLGQYNVWRRQATTALYLIMQRLQLNPGPACQPYHVVTYGEARKMDYLMGTEQMTVNFRATSPLSAEAMDELREKFRWAFDAVLSPFSWTRNKFNALKLRLLDSQFLVLPLKRNVQLLVTSDDVIHSLALPSAGIKTDALPGRINSLVCSFFRNALMFGQCSELCGAGHGFMPISFLVLGEGYLAYTVADLAAVMLSIVERYKMSYAPTISIAGWFFYHKNFDLSGLATPAELSLLDNPGGLVRMYHRHPEFADSLPQ